MQLQEEYLKMLMEAGIFDKEVAFTVVEIEISQSANRVLLGCLASGNKEVIHFALFGGGGCCSLDSRLCNISS